MPNAGSIERLGIGAKLIYGSGQMVDSAVQNTLTVFLLFYLTAVCGMSAGAAGLILLLSLTIDAVADPFIGHLSDRFRSRWGRRLPFMAVALLPLAAALVALFSLPAQLGGTALFLYVLALNIAVRIALSVFSLPYSALAAEISHDYDERSSIMAYRSLFIVAGFALCVGLGFNLIFSGPQGLLLRSGYPALGMLVGVVAVAAGYFCTLGVAPLVGRLPDAELKAGRKRLPFLRGVGELLRNLTFLKLFGGALIILVGGGAVSSLNLHAYRFYWGLNTAQIQFPTMAFPVGMLLGVVVAGVLLRRVEKRTGALFALALVGLSQGLIVALQMLGLGPAEGPWLLVMLICNSVVFGLCTTLFFICFQSMAADTVDEHEHLFGSRCEGLIFASLLFAAKAASGMGGMLAGLCLAWIGFPGGLAPTSQASVPAEAVQKLGLVWGPGFALFIALGIPFFLAYRLDRRRHAALLGQAAS